MTVYDGEVEEYEPAEGSRSNGQRQEAGLARRETMGGTELARTAETAVAAAAEQARAMVEARYAMALRRRRDLQVVRQAILLDCARPGFAWVAEYAKPYNRYDFETRQYVKDFHRGPSIRFVESGLRSMTNVLTSSQVVYDDPDKMAVRVYVIDCETNVGHEEDFTVRKTVERSNARGRDVVGRRTNSDGKLTYIVVATDDELSNKINSFKSKSIRNLGLRIIPGDLVEEGMALAKVTREKQREKNPKEFINRVVDALLRVRVSAKMIVEYLGHQIEEMSADEQDRLIAIGSAIRDGETTWRAIMEDRGDKPEASKPGAAAAPKDMKARVVAKAQASKQPEAPTEQPQNGPPMREPGED